MKILNIIATLLTCTCIAILFFEIGKYIGRSEYARKVDDLSNEVAVCNSMWKLEANEFYSEVCEVVCEQKFEKMGC